MGQGEQGVNQAKGPRGKGALLLLVPWSSCHLVPLPLASLTLYSSCPGYSCPLSLAPLVPLPLTVCSLRGLGSHRDLGQPQGPWAPQSASGTLGSLRGQSGSASGTVGSLRGLKQPHQSGQPQGPLWASWGSQSVLDSLRGLRQPQGLS